MKEKTNEKNLQNPELEDISIYDFEDDDSEVWDFDQYTETSKTPLDKIPFRSARDYFRNRRKRVQHLSYEEKIKEHQKQVAIRTSTIVLVLLIAVIGFVLIKDNVAYSKYKVLETEQRDAGTAVEYVEVYDRILRYSKDGASYYEERGKNIWNETYEMQNPMSDVCGKYIVIAEENGHQVYVFNLEGLVKNFDTAYPIVDAQVSEKGTVILLLKENEGDGHWIQYYDAKGDIIAEGRLPFKNEGYPLSMSLSADGQKLIVSYLKTEAERMNSHVVFYNFTSAGAAQTDNIVSEKIFEDTIVPIVYYSGNGKMLAISEDAAYIYIGSQTPREHAKVEFASKIQTVFYDEDYFGYIYESPSEKTSYRMEVYDYNAKQTGSCEFDFPYESVKIQDGQVVLYNDSQWSIYSVSGKLRLKPCDFSGMMQDVVPLSKRQFMLISARKTETVKIK